MWCRWLAWLALSLTCLASFGATGKHGATDSHSAAQQLIAKGLDHYKAEEYGEAMRNFLDAEKTATDADDYDRLFSAWLNIGNCYLFVGETGEALDRYTKAYELAVKQRLGWKQENYILNCMSAVYFEENDLEKARTTVERCHRSAQANRDTSSVITYALNLALIANKQGRAAASNHYIEEVATLSQQGRWASFRSSLAFVDCDADYHFERDTAFIRKAEALLVGKQISTADRTELRLNLIRTYKKRGDYRHALSLIERAMLEAMAQEKYELFKLSADIYRLMGDKEATLRCQDSLLAYTDSLVAMRNKQLVERNKARMQIFQAQSEMEKRIAQLEQNHRIYILLLCLSVLAVSFCVMLLVNMRSRARRNRQLMALRLEREKQEKQLAERQMKETELIAHYQKQLMEQSLEEKKREMSTTMLFVNARNNLLEDLVKRLSDLGKGKGDKEIDGLIAHLRQLLKDNESDAFLAKVDTANSEFMTTLQRSHPSLSPSDVRFLAFVRMNLSNKEISSLLNITPESCKMRKIRLCKKLGLATTQELYTYIAQL